MPPCAWRDVSSTLEAGRMINFHDYGCKYTVKKGGNSECNTYVLWFTGIAQTSSSNELSHKLFFEKLPNGLTFCKICGRAVSHMKNHFTTHSNEKAQCPVCFVFRSRPDNLKRHIKAVHPDYPL